ncbi:hypothetical protein ACFSJY_07250 [Thalassotalea euphylliae]|uniref:hypothetical protein n=1 Tax=Thalassotalea euphylliae TaxID=1655234 RepID=UPI003629BC7B
MSELDEKLNNLVWSDSTISNYSHDLAENSFLLELKDYLFSQIKISFLDVDYSFIDDPVYISDAKFKFEDNLYVIELLDDDGIVLKLKYLNCEVRYI